MSEKVPFTLADAANKLCALDLSDNHPLFGEIVNLGQASYVSVDVRLKRRGKLRKRDREVAGRPGNRQKVERQTQPLDDAVPGSARSASASCRASWQESRRQVNRGTASACRR